MEVMEVGGKRQRVEKALKTDRWASDSDEDEQPQSTKSRKATGDKEEIAGQQPQPQPQRKHQAEVKQQETLLETNAGGLIPQTAVAGTVRKTGTDSYNPLFYGCRSIEVYEPVGRIDEGTYGVVFKARCTITGEIVAVKQVKFGSSAPREGFPMTALREANILLSLRHPNILRVKEMVVGSSFEKLYMVMEYMDMDLKAVMQRRKFSLSETKRLMLQLLSAMEYMHRCWYLHRDLKTSNLLYNKRGKLAVCDFGLARKYGSPIAPYTQLVVTLWYRAPELLLGATEYSTPIDIWSVGCIMAELLLGGEPLVPGQGEVDQINKIFSLIGSPTEEKWPGCSTLPHIKQGSSWRWPATSSLREKFPRVSYGDVLALSDVGYDLLGRLLEMDPAKRISAAEALKHPWFSEHPLPTPEDMMPGIPQER